MSVVRIAGAGSPPRFLVILRGREQELLARGRVAFAAWHTTAREAHVLHWLAQGDANKEIAVKLGCSEVSVERHVTSLMRKARCDGRARLIVRFWTMDAEW